MRVSDEWIAGELANCAAYPCEHGRLMDSALRELLALRAATKPWTQDDIARAMDEAADALDAKDAEIARLTETERYAHATTDELQRICEAHGCLPGEHRLRWIERQLAERDALRAGIDRIKAQASDATEYVLAVENKAQKAALAFAVGAINDAIYTEDGLDGDTGQRVLHIIAEALELGTFDVAAYGDVPALCRMSDLEAAQARVEAAERDAARYRWLRRPTTLGVGMVMLWQRGKGRYDYAQGAELDAAIDAARGGA